MGWRFAKRCVLEWRACAMLNTVTLGLIGALFSTIPDPYICRTLLYIAFVVGLWALVIVIIYLVNFQDSEESGLWLSYIYRTREISSNFLALPALWSTWALVLLSVSFLSYLWHSPGESSDSSSSAQGTDTPRLAGHTYYPWYRLLPTAVFPIALWNIWAIHAVISHRLSDTS